MANHVGSCVGELETAREKLGMWLGVELDERVGKHNGTLNGKTYFKCQKMHGIFVRPTNCRKVSERITRRACDRTQSTNSGAPGSGSSEQITSSMSVSLNPSLSRMSKR